MALRKFSYKIGPEHARARLDQFLAERIPESLGKPVSKAKVRQLIVAGAVYLNGKRVRIASKELIPGARVEALVDEKKLFADAASRERPFEFDSGRILYEDEWLIAVDKPAGVPTQPTIDEARTNLFAAVKKFLGHRDEVAQPYLGLHHRLDRDTSGVILFTKSKEANAGVGELFSKHLAQKTYHALAQHPRGEAPWDGKSVWTVKNYLGKAPGPGKRARFTAVRSGGDYAETAFRVLEETKGCLLVEAMPKTGRTHQIRVHLSEEGMPILGDALYGAKPESAPRVMLHAARLTFPHPIHKNQISIQSPIPEDFQKCLQSCRSSRVYAR